MGKIGAEGAEARETQKAKDVLDIGTQYVDQGVGRIGATGQEDRKTVEAKGEQERMNISLQSQEGREDKRLDARLKAKERSDESSYARGLAGKF